MSTPIVLRCAHCNKIIFEGEEYNRENEYGPDEHVKCAELKAAKEREERKQELERIVEKEARGEKLTFDEASLQLDQHISDALRYQLFAPGGFFGRPLTEEELKLRNEFDIDLPFKPKQVYATITLERSMTTSKAEEIVASRGPIYGEARINLACTQELCDVFDKYIGNNKAILGSLLGSTEEYRQEWYNAHKAAMHLVLTKVARIATGAFHEDNYLDIEGYTILARKIMKGESTLPEKR